MTDQPMIDVHALRKRYRATTVLDGVDFAVGRGEIFAMLGPNGAGKTTTVNILSTLVSPDSGSATINGVDVLRDPRAARRVIALTGQYASVDAFQTGRENLGMMARLTHLPPHSARVRVSELLERFGLTDAAGRRAGTYSGGMRRRLDLAISLLAAPPVLFLDEPTTGLDPRSRNDMWTIVRELSADGTTVFLTTQYLEEADQLADQVAVLDHGRIIDQGTPDELKSRVGAAHLEITLSDPSALQRAARLRLPGAQLDAGVGVLRIPASDPARAIRDFFATAGDLAVENIAIVGPSLDDVFLALTGAPADTAGGAPEHTSTEVAA